MASIRLLNAATATNSAPTAATDGAAVKKKDTAQPGLMGSQKGLLLIKSTAGSGTMTGTFKLWGYMAATTPYDISGWYPLGTHATAASKGLINEANAVGETGSDSIRHCEVIENIGAFDRLYLEITAIGGTATAFSAYVVSLPGVER